MRPRSLRSKLLTAAVAGAVLVGGGWSAVALADPKPDTEPRYDLAEAIQETVYIESDMDSDGDGKKDRIAAQLKRPDAAGEKFPVIVQPSPYYGLNRKDIAATGIQLPFEGSPRHFTSWYGDYFVPRGYGYIEVEMQGTGESEGCPTTGGPEDTASVTALVDWIAGRATAVDADGKPVTADWAEPSVGMIGVSYNGTLPNAVATTGIKELKTIVPIAAISSWYDYARDDGTAYLGWDDDYPRRLADAVASDRARQMCGAVFEELSAGADDATYDFNDFWKERDYTAKADSVTASTLIVHGQNDWNVRTTHAKGWWDALRANDVPAKLWLHPGDHIDWTVTPQGNEYVQRWFDHWLKDVDTGIMDEPAVIVDRFNGTRDTYPDWPNPEGADTTLYFGDDPDSGAGVLTPDGGGSGSHVIGPGNAPDEVYMAGNPSEARPERKVYLGTPLEAAQQLSGASELDVQFSSTSASTTISALLVSYSGDGSTYEIISRGSMDGKNYASLEQEQPLAPGEKYTGTFDFEPRDAVIPAGNRLGVVMLTNHVGYVKPDTQSDQLEVHLGDSRLRVNLTKS